MMVFYHGRQFHSASIGGRMVEVVCEKCGRGYFYELTRMGSGSATAPYAIGSAGAARSADAQAKRDLERRLREEAELVPCPDCRWINEGLVEGYRLGRHRGWTTAAVLVGIVGSVASMVMAWFVSTGPAADRGALNLFLVDGPVLSVAIAGSILGLRSFLRGRIDPNRNYPMAPSLPQGSPKALTRNRETGELEVAGSVAGSENVGRGWMDFQVGRSALPSVCCGCLGTPAARSAYQRLLHPAVVLVVPLCSPCARIWNRQKWLGALVGFGLIAVVGLPISWALKLDEIVFWMAVAALGVLAPVIGAMVRGHSQAPVGVKVVDGARGVVRLWFRNPDFLGRSRSA